ncbi:hypothetical protein Trco_008246 [Trichoderma cornu-damae]|uniref:Uncharacterized protein n=1 Tax=Trichoderma cornu-damae TaxID=654480 RepID=A0A9P8TRD0_9HYPO|nr:hypothetical protein Trco_008246 [Trichoderma cornu-damae]
MGDSTVFSCRSSVGKASHGRSTAKVANIVFNAQPFGGGPGATLAAVMPHLRSRLKSLEPVALHYVGSSLAMDFPKLSEAEWDGLHNVDLYTNPEAGKGQLVSLLRRLKPRLLVTAMDEHVAAAAQAAGVPFVVIDLLLWFWPSTPRPWYHAELVIAAEFFGVQDRIATARLSNAVTVPPLGPPPRTAAGPLKDVLLNFGGMVNPLMPEEEYIAYAQLVYSVARRAINRRNAAVPKPQHARLIVLVASLDVAQSIDVEGPDVVRMVLPDEALELMASAELVCCTAGLGNLYAAGAVANAVLLLPFLHEGHAIQTCLIRRAGIAVDAVQWHELTGGEYDSFFCRPLEAMIKISRAQNEVARSPQAQTAFVDRILEAMLQSAASATRSSARDPPLRALIDAFGQDDGNAMAAHIFNVLKKVR